MLNRFCDYNANGYECNYNVNYNQQPYYTDPRRHSGRRSKRNDDLVDARDAEKRKALEAANLKKGLGTKIEEGNKGYEMLVENGKGLGRNAEAILEPLMLAKKSDSAVATQQLSKSQRKRMRRKENKKAKIAAEQVQKNNKQQLAVAKEVVVATPQQVKKVKSRAVAVKPAISPKPQQAPTVKHKLETAVARKLPQQVIALHEQEIATTTAPPLEIISISKSDKVKFSVKDPCTTEFLHSLRQVLSLEIELMQLRLAAEASLNQLHDDNELIVAKIYIDNNSNVPDHVIEFLRNELIGWIGLYQQEGLATPIFYSITNNSSHITIVCENKYAFECLSRCIEDIVQKKTMESLKVIRLPHITPFIHCFDAKYEGIASDAGLFLTQLHLHKPKLYTDNWVVVSQEICAEQRKTFFIFLVDQRSALALHFHYSHSFFVCMQQVTFRNRGIIKETILN